MDKNTALRDMQAAYLNRWAQTVNPAQSLIFEMRLRGRMVVGLGGKNALEFGITLHHTTGMPIIPGSAIKGAARSYALLSIAAASFPEIFASDGTIDGPALDSLDKAMVNGKWREHRDADHYRRIFGRIADGNDTPSVAGDCVFHDAIVSRLPAGSLYAVDVMTPHFTSYYTKSGAEPPTDSDNPVPVSFLTVSQGATFAFAVGKRQPDVSDKLVKRAAQWVALAADELGLGAKTAAGYGVFQLIEGEG